MRERRRPAPFFLQTVQFAAALREFCFWHKDGVIGLSHDSNRSADELFE
jgi:hypothetical protein